MIPAPEHHSCDHLRKLLRKVAVCGPYPVDVQANVITFSRTTFRGILTDKAERASASYQ